MCMMYLHISNTCTCNSLLDTDDTIVATLYKCINQSYISTYDCSFIYKVHVLSLLLNITLDTCTYTCDY